MESKCTNTLTLIGKKSTLYKFKEFAAKNKHGLPAGFVFENFLKKELLNAYTWGDKKGFEFIQRTGIFWAGLDLHYTRYEFKTIEFPPIPVIDAAAKKFKTLEFRLKYEDEFGFFGERDYRKGVCIASKDGYFKDGKFMPRALWGENPLRQLSL